MSILKQYVPGWLISTGDIEFPEIVSMEEHHAIGVLVASGFCVSLMSLPVLSQFQSDAGVSGEQSS